MIKFQQSPALTSHFESFWSIMQCDNLRDFLSTQFLCEITALLAHLACEKHVWGPHLIVVPTSVMLNWEMEIKKWAPAFKVLTYFGTQKERRLKRVGWTKPNAFHVCITSYKLVTQDHSSFRRKVRYLHSVVKGEIYPLFSQCAEKF